MPHHPPHSFADRDQPRAAVGTFATIIPVPARRDGGTGLVTPLDARAADSFSTAHEV